jgi:hypothetical protein
MVTDRGSQITDHGPQITRSEGRTYIHRLRILNCSSYIQYKLYFVLGWALYSSTYLPVETDLESGVVIRHGMKFLIGQVVLSQALAEPPQK